MTPDITPTLLLILDGWGQAPAGEGNAPSLAKMPVLNRLTASAPKSTLLCSGRAVGLPEGFMGNSEVGHMNIGAGRIVYQDLTRIDIAVEEGAFAANPVIAGTLAAAQRSGGTLHLMGLLSDGGVHSSIRHLFALLEAAAAAKVPVAVHAFMDGRDTDPHSGLGFIRQLEEKLAVGQRIASVCGRYYAMDRDKRWDRTQIAWDALVNGIAATVPSAGEAVQAAYGADETDEFIKPRLIVPEGEKPCLIEGKDAAFFFNFRADRARQLTECLYLQKKFKEFDRKRVPLLSAFGTMTRYDAHYPIPAAFLRQDSANGLGEIISNAGLAQLRIAETEKYAHVTYFFNGGVEEPFPGEERRLIPSPRDVATYDLKPEMSVNQVTDTLIEEWNSGKYRFVVCNFANLDMVGHTGIIPAAVQACEAVDACVARVLEAVQASKGRLLITADHGNAEEMYTSAHTPQTAHSKNPVAFLLIDEDKEKKLRGNGKLGDIGPTVLRLWGMPVPEDMTGESLFVEE